MMAVHGEKDEDEECGLCSFLNCLLPYYSVYVYSTVVNSLCSDRELNRKHTFPFPTDTINRNYKHIHY